MLICDRCYPGKVSAAAETIVFSKTDEHKNLCSQCIEKIKEAMKPAAKRGRKPKEI
jgi:hypothetical protein